MDEADSTTLFASLMDTSAEKVNWNRAQALEALEKANEIERQAAEVADKYRQLAATLISEASAFASDVGDLLMAEFPTDE